MNEYTEGRCSGAFLSVLYVVLSVFLMIFAGYVWYF